MNNSYFWILSLYALEEQSANESVFGDCAING